MVLSKAVGGDVLAESQWMVEPCRSLFEKNDMLDGQTLCHGAQVEKTISVEV